MRLQPLCSWAVAGLVSCTGPTESSRTLVHATPAVPSDAYVDEQGRPVSPSTEDAVRIREKVGTSFVSVTAPDGHQVTWGEFRRAAGVVQLACQVDGTHIDLRAEGLIPKGVYTGWLLFFRSSTFAQPASGALAGVAPLGAPEGTENGAIADGSGGLRLAPIQKAGQVTVSMLASGEKEAIPLCLLDAGDVQIELVYHMGGRTYGSMPPPMDKSAPQLAWEITGGKAAAVVPVSQRPSQ